MNVHSNARLTPLGRDEMVRRVVDQGQTPKAVATDVGVCERTVRKWVARFRAEGTRPYTPKTNGKAERFIQTALREWAYARAYSNSYQRTRQLPDWLHRYNWHRPHASLNANTPISRLRLPQDNPLMLHS